LVATVIVVVTVAPLGLTILGLKEHPDAGIVSEQLNCTLSVNPTTGVTLIVTLTGTPAVVVTLPGFAASVNPAVPCVQPGWAMRQKKAPTNHDASQRFLIQMVNIFFLLDFKHLGFVQPK
jgi:hypothetical protein